ncbi:MAG: hypothetical protein RQ760_20475, partial [Sedimentisphaerales bacterium]|nr:hypothetical protein [Sedimentisphaerales bacterium]
MFKKKTNNNKKTFSQNVLIDWFKNKKIKNVNTIEDQSKTRPEAQALDESEEQRKVEKQERVDTEERAKACEELQTRTEVEVKDKTEGMADANSFDTIKDRKRGVSPAEILRLIEKAEERKRNQGQVSSGKETRSQVEQKGRSGPGEKINT